MKTILWLLLFTTCSCATIDPREKTGIDSEFSEQVKLFESLFGKKVKDVPINFGDFSGEERIGVCITHTSDFPPKLFREIFIDPVYWETATLTEKETLILHELGHCVLGRSHVTDTKDYQGFEIPKSIMYPTNFGGNYYYLPNRKYYHEELVGER